MHQSLHTAARLALLCSLAAGGSLADAARGQEPTGPRSGEVPAPARLQAVAIGVPGPFSEAESAVAARSLEARALGLDALWWAASDACMTREREHLRVSFEPDEGASETPAESGHDHAGHAHGAGPSAPASRPRLVQLPERSFATGDARWSDERARDGARSYQVTAASLAPELRPFVTELRLPAPGYRRPLAGGPRLSLALWIDGAGDDGLAWIELRLSRHPPVEPRDENGRAAPPPPPAPAETIALRYVLGGDAELREPRRERGEQEQVLWIPLEHRERDWTVLELDPLADVARGFPELDAADNALTALWLGIGTRRSQAVTAFLDDLRIEGGGSGAALFELQRELLARAAAAHAAPAQLQAVELSAPGLHLDLLGVDAGVLAGLEPAATEPAHHSHAGSSDSDRSGAERARAAVAAARAAGGLAQLGTPLGAAPARSEPEHDREELLAELLEQRLFGAELLEVGQHHRGGHRLRDHLWVWDRLALEGGLRPVGTGGAELVEGQPWSEAPNRFVTWIAAPAPTEELLLEGLRAGRVAFGDPLEFRGALELSTARGQRLGQLVVTDRRELELDIRVDGLEATDRVIVVESGELTRYLDVEGPSFRARERIDLPPEGGFVRIESFARPGTPLVFSNPIHFLREVPPEGLDPARGAIDLAGVRSLDLGGLRLTAARVLAGGEDAPARVELEGTGTGGTLVLERLGPSGPEPLDPARLRLDGLRGRATLEGTRLSVEGLTGTGRLLVGG